MKLMTQDEQDDLDKRNFLYRCEGEVSDSFMSFVSYRIVFRKHFIIKETPCGYWVEDRHYWKKWVSKDGRKRFAHLTKKEALFAFKKRKEKQIQILESQLHGAKQMLTEANKIDLENIELGLLEKELADLKASNLSAWNMYGSELSAGSMSAQEKILEEKIRRLKENDK